MSKASQIASLVAGLIFCCDALSAEPQAAAPEKPVAPHRRRHYEEPSAAQLRNECFGTKSAKGALVYLHGLDTPEMNHDELNARKVLWQLAQAGDLRIALPRSRQSCHSKSHRRDMLCWQASTPSQAKVTLGLIEEQARGCLGEKERPVLLGYSNGGWFANKLLRWCVPHKFSKVIALGAGGAFDRYSPKEISSCGLAIEMIGKSDAQNLKLAKAFYQQAKQRGAQITLVLFDGGHALNLQTLLSIFGQE